MIKKIIALGLVIIAAYIVLPYGFGLWNENIGILSQITFADSAVASPDQIKTAEELFPSVGSPATSDGQSENEKEEAAVETADSEQTQAGDKGMESEIISNPDNIVAPAPQAVEPVDAEDNTQNNDQVQQKPEEANDSTSEKSAD